MRVGNELHARNLWARYPISAQRGETRCKDRQTLLYPPSRASHCGLGSTGEGPLTSPRLPDVGLVPLE